MNKRKKSAITSVMAIALAVASATSTTKVGMATETVTTTVAAEATTTAIAVTESSTKAIETTTTEVAKTATSTTAKTTTMQTAEASTTAATQTEAATTTATEIEPTITDAPKVGDMIWVSDEEVTYWAADHKFKSVCRGKMRYEIYIIGDYDENNWRVHIPMMNQPERVILLEKSWNDTLTVLSHDGYIVGDLCHDGKINGFDLILLRRALFEDFNLDDYSDIDALVERSWVRALADVNDDQEISVADLVSMSNFLLGRSKGFK